MKVVVADPLPASALHIFKSVPGWQVRAAGEFPADALATEVADADALVVRSATNVDRVLIERAARLRVIARAGTGVDNVDVDAATDRGIVVMNAPGANSISVAELAIGLMLATSRGIAAADAAMKRGTWDKKKLTGAELRGKKLGIVGLGRIGQEVAARARAFGMEILAHDPYLSEEVAESMGVRMGTLDEVCAASDYLTLHLPVTPETRHLLDRARLSRCKRGIRIINTARGELIDADALAEAIESGHVAGAALDVFESEPPSDWRLAQLPQVVATPHIAASTVEAQELVGTETAIAVREFLLHGTITNAVNFPGIRPDDAARLRPFLLLADRLGAFVAQLEEVRTRAVGIRTYGPLLESHGALVTSAAVAGLLRPILSSAVTIVNARAVAAGRGIEVIESHSSRPREFSNLLSVKLHTSGGSRWVEGAVFEPGRVRLVQLDGVDIEAPLEGTLLVIANDDQPGVIGRVGTILGSHGINIASFSLGRGPAGAVGVVNLDAEPDRDLVRAVDELRGVPGIRRVSTVRL